MRRIPQDVADFLFHAATIAAGTALQAGFHTIFKVADNQLGHRFPLFYSDIMISFLMEARKSKR
jgi:hypothetical protein